MEAKTQNKIQHTQKTQINQIIELLTREEIEIEEINDEKEIQRMLLTLELSSRFNCGFIYDYYDKLYLMVGEVDVVKLSENSDECVDKAKLLIIPRTVPVTLALISVDENPQFESYVQLFIFDGSKWISVTLPYISSYAKMFEQYTRIW